MNNREKFLKLVSENNSGTIDRIKDRIKNRAYLNESQQIALKILTKLEALNWSQKDLAAQMHVSPQQINKIVRGKENLTLETLIKVQNILGIPVLASFYENSEANATGLANSYHTLTNIEPTLPVQANYSSKGIWFNGQVSTGNMVNYDKKTA
ncbi:MAG TPA: XRE family transcriptional regulator [Bacteroidales bacterium]|nr:XRE family transcriptional regulator [Bacteroidales bacterium]